VRQPTPRSLIVDLLSTLRHGSMPVAALCQAGTLFGIAEGSVRVALHRLQSEGRVESDERGQYRLGAAAAPVQSVVAGWRDLDRRTRAWNGRWIAVHATAPRRRRTRIDPAAQALRLFGFEPLATGLQVRPANLREGTVGVRTALHELGLPSTALVAELGELDSATDARARSLWDGDALVRSYRAARREIEASSARLHTLPEPEAMVESFRLGGRVLQQLVLDPAPARAARRRARAARAGREHARVRPPRPQRLVRLPGALRRSPSHGARGHALGGRGLREERMRNFASFAQRAERERRPSGGRPRERSTDPPHPAGVA
jgi:phenylacetic acid degradation operon negative regulatory protein